MAKSEIPPPTFLRDFISGTVVFLVALPLCLGVALASRPADAANTPQDVPTIAGIIAGVIGGIVVGILSKSQTSVSGPAAGLTAVVAAQIALLGSYQGFLAAVVIAGALQIVFGIFRLGFISGFFPNCVIKGLLAAIGLLLILKQIPHLFGHDADADGEMAFSQPDGQNTFSEIIETAFNIDMGASLIGIASILFLLSWDRIKNLKKSIVPAPLIVVILGVILAEILRLLGGKWPLDIKHLVQVPVFDSATGIKQYFQFPDWSFISNPKLYTAAITIAIVASLETLLNIEAVDKLDPKKRNTPTSRELVSQGIANMTSGMIGGLPLTSVIVRSSVNINAGGQTKLATIIHGIFLAACVVILPGLLNRIPLSCLAAILIVTGLKLINLKLIKSMWYLGWTQFLPFATTVIAIVGTDLLKGILIGLVVSIGFILASNLRRPLWRVVEKHIGGDVLHIHLASQVSFLNRGALTKAFEAVEPGNHVLIDARDTDYIDPDILDMIHEFEQERAPAHNIRVSLLGFRQHYEHVEDKILFADFTSRELRDELTPATVLQILRDGNERFATGTRISRDLNRQMAATSSGQFPMAAVLSCIDSRAPTELVFDLGLGDIFTIRIAGNVAREKVLGSLEYAAVVAGVKLIVVMGHTRCGAVGAAVQFAADQTTALKATGCEHIDVLTDEIQKSIVPADARVAVSGTDEIKQQYVDIVARRNVLHMMDVIKERSSAIRKKIEDGSVKVVGCIYDISTGRVSFDLPA